MNVNNLVGIGGGNGPSEPDYDDGEEEEEDVPPPDPVSGPCQEMCGDFHGAYNAARWDLAKAQAAQAAAREKLARMESNRGKAAKHEAEESDRLKKAQARLKAVQEALIKRRAFINRLERLQGSTLPGSDPQMQELARLNARAGDAQSEVSRAERRLKSAERELEARTPAAAAAKQAGQAAEQAVRQAGQAVNAAANALNACLEKCGSLLQEGKQTAIPVPDALATTQPRTATACMPCQGLAGQLNSANSARSVAAGAIAILNTRLSILYEQRQILQSVVGGAAGLANLQGEIAAMQQSVARQRTAYGESSAKLRSLPDQLRDCGRQCTTIELESATGVSGFTPLDAEDVISVDETPTDG